MKRIIVDYKKLTQNILDLLVGKYPDGYNDNDIIMFKNAAGELVEAVEVRTDDTIYLVKVSIKLEEKMENFIDDDNEEDSEDSRDDLNIDDDQQEDGLD